MNGLLYFLMLNNVEHFFILILIHVCNNRYSMPLQKGLETGARMFSLYKKNGVIYSLGQFPSSLSQPVTSPSAKRVQTQLFTDLVFFLLVLI